MNEHCAFLWAHIAFDKTYPGGGNPKPLGRGTCQAHQDVHALLGETVVERGGMRVKKMKEKEVMKVKKMKGKGEMRAKEIKENQEGTGEGKRRGDEGRAA